MRISKPGFGIILSILIVGIPFYFFITYLLQAPWGNADINTSVQSLVDDLSRKATEFHKIRLGHRLASDNTLHDSSWKGYFDYDATIDGAPSKVRITWVEVLGVNTITKIERIDIDAGPTTIWDRSPNGSAK